MGVPTMVHVIIASGMQNPRSVRVPRFGLSSYEGGREKEKEREREKMS